MGLLERGRCKKDLRRIQEGAACAADPRKGRGWPSSTRVAHGYTRVDSVGTPSSIDPGRGSPGLSLARATDATTPRVPVRWRGPRQGTHENPPAWTALGLREIESERWTALGQNEKACRPGHALFDAALIVVPVDGDPSRGRRGGTPPLGPRPLPGLGNRVEGSTKTHIRAPPRCAGMHGRHHDAMQDTTP